MNPPSQQTSEGESGPPPESAMGAPVRDLHPTMDARFVLVEIGKLTSKVDRLIDDVATLTRNVSELRGHVAFVKGAFWVVGGLVVVGAALSGAIVSGKLRIGFG